MKLRRVALEKYDTTPIDSQCRSGGQPHTLLSMSQGTVADAPWPPRTLSHPDAELTAQAILPPVVLAAPCPVVSLAIELRQYWSWCRQLLMDDHIVVLMEPAPLPGSGP